MTARNLGQFYSDEQLINDGEVAFYTTVPACVPAVESGRYASIRLRGTYAPKFGLGVFEVLLCDNGVQVACLHTAILADARATARTWAGVADEGVDYIGQAWHKFRVASVEYERALASEDQDQTPEALAELEASEQAWLEACARLERLTGILS